MFLSYSNKIWDENRALKTDPNRIKKSLGNTLKTCIPKDWKMKEWLNVYDLRKWNSEDINNLTNTNNLNNE